MTIETTKEVSELLATAGVEFSASREGLRRDGDKPADWVYDAWNITIRRRGSNTMTVNYKTGIGHRRNKAGNAPPIMPKFYELKDAETWLEGFGNVAKNGPYRAKAPDAASVIHSLLLDSDAAEMSFQNWCDNYGYDSDSISAFNTYQACEKIAQDLNKVFKRSELEELRAMLEDF